MITMPIWLFYAICVTCVLIGMVLLAMLMIGRDK